MSEQDWDSVTRIGYKVNANRTATARTASEINAARRAGTIVATEKKYAGGGNVQRADTEGQKMAKIDRENEVAPPPKLDKEVGKIISKARMDKGLNQKDFAVKINEKTSIINDYEQGRAIPTQQVLAKMERVLGVKLRGKNIGGPLFPKK